MGISIGMVGLGAFAQDFIPMFQSHPLVDRLALCDINPDKLSAAAKKHQVAETYDSLDAICKSDLQALVIMTQHWLHAPQVIQALNSGKHAYSAVPIICLDDGDEMLGWCDKLIETCKRTGQHYMMGETSYYRPEAMYCRKKAAEGAFGHFIHGEGRYLHETDRKTSNLREVMMWRYGKDWNIRLSGGVPMHYPTHSTGGIISVMRAHMTEVSAFGVAIPGDDWYRKDTVSSNLFGSETALFRMSNGATAEICEWRRCGIGCFEGFSIYGSKASAVHYLQDGKGLQWTHIDGEVEHLDPEAMRDPLPAEVVAAFTRSRPGRSTYGGHGGSHAFLVHEFVEAVHQNRRPTVNAWEAVRYVVPGIMAHKSVLKDGELLKVPDWGDAPQ
jgi:predicted dehydrogenase